MYIAPNSELRILKDIPIDSSYSDTLFFPSKVAQENYFIGQTKYVLNGQPNSDGSLLSYVRIEEGVIKFELPIQNILDCNYIMFRNISFGNKWIYAFITSREYVNNVTTRITFEIDVMQTWFLFDTTMYQCFVEREHSATDNIGDNLLTEPITPDVYYEEPLLDSNNTRGVIEWKDYSAVMFVIKEPQTSGGSSVVNPSILAIRENGSVGIRYCAPANGRAYIGGAGIAGQMAVDLGSLGGDYNRVINCILFPRNLIGGTVEGGYIDDIEPVRQRLSFPIANVDLEGYVPKNNKMYTYPYNFIILDNSNKEVVIKWEEFADKINATFELFGYATPTPQVTLSPTGYLGSGTYTDGLDTLYRKVNPIHGISIDSFPQAPLPVDAYNAWVAQKSTGDMLGVASDIMVGGARGAQMTGGSWQGALVGGLVGLTSGTASFLQNALYAQDASDSYKGNASTVIDSIHGTLGFRVKQRCVRAENARVIDDFFTMYGYACGKVKQPNIAVRPHWTYTKTNGCKIVGSCSNDDILRIESIFNNGVRFWMNPLEVGNYSLNNAPI